MTKRTIFFNELVGYLVLLLLFGVFVLWSATEKLDGAVIASGSLTHEQNSSLIQHQEGGTVTEIKVSEGEFVRTGATLVELDKTQLEARLSVTETSIVELSNEKARLEAERDGKAIIPSISFQPAFASLESVRDSHMAHQRLHETIIKTLDKKNDQLNEQLSQTEAIIKGYTSQLSSANRQIQLAEEELVVLSGLKERQLISRDRIVSMQRDLAQLKGNKGELEATIARYRAEGSELNLKIVQLHEQRRAQVFARIGETQIKLAQLKEQLVVDRARLARSSIKAPISGYVHNLALRNVGGVVKSGDTIMSIVTGKQSFAIEARVRPQDIDSVSVNQKVRVRFSTLHDDGTPEVIGFVSMVSADKLDDAKTGAAFFQIEIQLFQDEARKLKGLPLRAGTPVDAFLILGERTVLSYLLKPFQDQIMLAFRD